MKRFPTIFDLAKADVEQVNEYWQGLGYYSRASRLLSGSKKVVEKFNGVLPEDPLIMEKEVDGIGPYSAGAIASIAYAKPVPMVDGNVHRVLSRLTALHAPQAAKATSNFLWSLAAQLVPEHRPGDFNQALMELGATICKPREASCTSCPLTEWCRAYQEAQILSQITESHGSKKSGGDMDIEDACQVCQPIRASTSSNDHILIYPMAKERKKPAIREVAVGVVIWKQSSSNGPADPLHDSPALTGKEMTLLIKRPDKGLLAGLWEFPSIDLPETNDSTSQVRLNGLKGLLSETIAGLIPSPVDSLEINGRLTNSNHEAMGSMSLRWADDLADVEHVFSHLRVTYKPMMLLIRSSTLPSLRNPKPTAQDFDLTARSGQSTWIPCSQIMKSNIGNPHKKVWSSSIKASSYLTRGSILDSE